MHQSQQRDTANKVLFYSHVLFFLTSIQIFVCCRCSCAVQAPTHTVPLPFLKIFEFQQASSLPKMVSPMQGLACTSCIQCNNCIYSTEVHNFSAKTSRLEGEFSLARATRVQQKGVCIRHVVYIFMDASLQDEIQQLRAQVELEKHAQAAQLLASAGLRKKDDLLVRKLNVTCAT
jgi:hypothetical protein